MRLAKCICPQCGGQIDIKSGLSQIKCDYCNSVIHVEGEMGVGDQESIRYELAQELADKIYALIKPWNELQILQTNDKQQRQRVETLEKWSRVISTPMGEKLHYVVIAVIMFFSIIMAVSHGNPGEIVAGVILSIGVYIFYLVKYKNIPDETAKCQAEREETIARIKKLTDEYDFNIIPEDYRNEDAMNFICKALKNRRAYTIQEAVNLYEDELHKRHITQLHEEQLAAQNSQGAELKKTSEKKIKNVSIDESLSTGSIIAAGVTIAKLAKYVKDHMD